VLYRSSHAVHKQAKLRATLACPSDMHSYTTDEHTTLALARPDQMVAACIKPRLRLTHTCRYVCGHAALSEQHTDGRTSSEPLIAEHTLVPWHRAIDTPHLHRHAIVSWMHSTHTTPISTLSPLNTTHCHTAVDTLMHMLQSTGHCPDTLTSLAVPPDGCQSGSPICQPNLSLSAQHPRLKAVLGHCRRPWQDSAAHTNRSADSLAHHSRQAEAMRPPLRHG
jgi:hypothetical protein